MRPCPKLSFPWSRRGGPGDPIAQTRRRPLPICAWPSPGSPASSQPSTPAAARRVRRVAPRWGVGPRGLFLCLCFRNHRFITPAFGSSRAHASPALPEEVESRWRRRVCVSSRAIGDSSAPLVSGSCNATSPSFLFHMLEFVPGRGDSSLYRYSGQKWLIRANTLFPKERLKTPLVALPVSFQPMFPSVLCIVSLPSSCDPAGARRICNFLDSCMPELISQRNDFSYRTFIAYVL